MQLVKNEGTEMIEVWGIVCQPRRADCCKGKRTVIETMDGLYRKKCTGCGNHTDWFRSLDELGKCSLRNA